MFDSKCTIHILKFCNAPLSRVTFWVSWNIHTRQGMSGFSFERVFFQWWFNSICPAILHNTRQTTNSLHWKWWFKYRDACIGNAKHSQLWMLSRGEAPTASLYVSRSIIESGLLHLVCSKIGGESVIYTILIAFKKS